MIKNVPTLLSKHNRPFYRLLPLSANTAAKTFFVGSTTMHFAFCLYKYFPYSGLARDFLRILKQAQKQGHTIDVYAAHWQGEIPKNTHVTVLKTHALSNHGNNKQFHEKLNTELQHTHYDASVGFNKIPGLSVYYCADFCYLAKVKHHNNAFYRFTPRFNYKLSFEKQVFSPSTDTLILALSERESSLYQQYHATPKARFKLLPPTLDKQLKTLDRTDQKRQLKRQELNLSQTDKLILLVGSGFKTKGLDRALLMISELPPQLKKHVLFWVAGQDNVAPFEQLVTKYNIAANTRFLGGRDDISDLMLAADCLVHPAYNENTGTSILEAIISGLPVVATDVCGYAPHIEKANCGQILKSPYSQNEFTRSVEAVLTCNNSVEIRQNGLNYGDNESLYQMPESAVEAICLHVTHTLHCSNDKTTAQPPLEAPQFYILQSYFDQYHRHADASLPLLPVEHSNGYELTEYRHIIGRDCLSTFSQTPALSTPVQNRWQAFHHLQRLQIASTPLMLKAKKRASQCYEKTILVSERQTNRRCLEDYIQTELNSFACKNTEKVLLKRCLIQRIAQICNQVHESNAAHNQLSLASFIVIEPLLASHSNQLKHILLLDKLEQFSIYAKLPARKRSTDIAQLYASCYPLKLSIRDCLRFVKAYTPHTPLKQSLSIHALFWKQVQSKANALFLASNQNYLHQHVFKQERRRYRVTSKHPLSHDVFTTVKHIVALSTPDSALKDDKTTTVFTQTVNSTEIVVKRYNTKNKWHAVRRPFQTSRAQNCMNMTAIFLAQGITTPQFIAQIQEYIGPFKVRSWFICSFIDGKLVSDLYQEPAAKDTPETERTQIKLFFKRLRFHGLSHGDLKATNLLIANEQLIAIDLDASRAHKSLKKQRYAQQKDRQRFLMNWQHAPDYLQLFSFLQDTTADNE